MAYHLLSATAIDLFNDCQRKWGFRYLAKIEVPKHPSAELGTDTHTQLGGHLIEGKPFDFTRRSGEVANALVPLLPPPKTPGLVVERKFEFSSPTGRFGYIGFIDIYAPDSACVPGLEGGVELLGDIKTTSNFKYAKSEEVLRRDTQAQLYSKALMLIGKRAELDLVWFYSKTSKPHRAQRIHLRVHASHVDEQFQRIDEIGARVAGIRTAKPNVDELPPNPRMCGEYGGCPYQHLCNLSPAVFAAAAKGEVIDMSAQPNSDFLASMRKDLAPAAPAPVAAQPPPAPIIVHESAQGVPDALPPWATAPVDPLRAKAAINPPESALPPAPPVGAAAPAAEEPPKKRGRPAKVVEAEAPAPVARTPVVSGFPVAEFRAFLLAWAKALEAA